MPCMCVALLLCRNSSFPSVNDIAFKMDVRAMKGCVCIHTYTHNNDYAFELVAFLLLKWEHPCTKNFGGHCNSTWPIASIPSCYSLPILWSSGSLSVLSLCIPFLSPCSFHLCAPLLWRCIVYEDSDFTDGGCYCPAGFKGDSSDYGRCIFILSPLS